MFESLAIDFTSEELQYHWLHAEKLSLKCAICKKLENLKRHISVIKPKKNNLKSDLKNEKRVFNV